MLQIKSDLPKETRDEIDRILAIPSGQRTNKENSFLTALDSYMTNEIIEKDSSGLILKAAGETVPTGNGFKKGAIFIKKDASESVLYQNEGDETTCSFVPISEKKGGTPVNAVAALSTLTSTNTNATAGKKVVIGSVEYTFVDALTTDPAAVPYEVLIGNDADATLANLVAAINGAEGEGSTYGTGTEAHPDVEAGTISAHAFDVTAKVSGEIGNQIAVSTDEATLSFDDETLLGGVDGTVAKKGSILVDESYLYVAIDDNSVADANWRRISVGVVY